MGIEPKAIELLAIVILQKPLPPAGPVMVKDIIVVRSVWLVVIVMLVICELVMLPSRDKVTFVPSSLVA
jgi:uncharacterized membrane protein (DUF4010 family)